MTRVFFAVVALVLFALPAEASFLGLRGGCAGAAGGCSGSAGCSGSYGAGCAGSRGSGCAGSYAGCSGSMGGAVRVVVAVQPVQVVPMQAPACAPPQAPMMYAPQGPVVDVFVAARPGGRIGGFLKRIFRRGAGGC